MKALCIGVHVLDVLVRPVERIPEGDGELVEEIRLTAAGSAGGTALVLAKLGAQVSSAGAVGADAAGDMLLSLLERGARCVIATLGADGVLIDGEEAVPAAEADVVDTTGCGDAFSAGFLRGLAAGLDRRAAAEHGCAVAARVAGGLGTDAGGLAVDA